MDDSNWDRPHRNNRWRLFLNRIAVPWTRLRPSRACGEANVQTNARTRRNAQASGRLTGIQSGHDRNRVGIRFRGNVGWNR
jgi:hypothetical protein